MEAKIIAQVAKMVCECDPGFFENNGVCEQCDSSCGECSGTATKCTKCKSGMKLQKAKCVSFCSTSYFFDSSFKCTRCNTGCFSCSLHPNNCQECEIGYFLDGNKCKPCFSHCATCNGGSATNYTTCETPYFLYGSKCVESCNDGYFSDESTHICQLCQNNCDKCLSVETCTKCKNGFTLIDDMCTRGEETLLYEDAGFIKTSKLLLGLAFADQL